MRVCKKFSFDSAHFLPGYDGKCKDLHGHQWTLEVEVEGKVGTFGMVMDFSYLKQVVNTKVISRLDHRLLNEVVEVPTAEHILLWIAEQLSQFGLVTDVHTTLTRLRLYETPDSFAELRMSGMQTSL